jgi:hypothetical protein
MPSSPRLVYSQVFETSFLNPSFTVAHDRYFLILYGPFGRGVHRYYVLSSWQKIKFCTTIHDFISAMCTFSLHLTNKFFSQSPHKTGNIQMWRQENLHVCVCRGGWDVWRWSWYPAPWSRQSPGIMPFFFFLLLPKNAEGFLELSLVSSSTFLGWWYDCGLYIVQTVQYWHTLYYVFNDKYEVWLIGCGPPKY